MSPDPRIERKPSLRLTLALTAVFAMFALAAVPQAVAEEHEEHVDPCRPDVENGPEVVQQENGEVPEGCLEQCLEDERNGENGPEITEDHIEVPLGCIVVCKVLVDSFSGEVVRGQFVFSTDFIIPALNGSEDIEGNEWEDSEFEAALDLDEDVVESVEGNDAECVVHNFLPLGDYFYGEEIVEDSELEFNPEYNDMGPVATLEDFAPYSGELFNEESEDDDERNTSADGHIVLTDERPHRMLVVKNTIPCIGPENVQATAEEGPQNRVTWDPFPDPDSYNIYRAVGNGSFSLIGSVDGDTEEFVDDDVEAGVTYRYQVSALIGEEESGRCAIAEVTAIPVLPTLFAGAMAALGGVGAYTLLRRRRDA